MKKVWSAVLLFWGGRTRTYAQSFIIEGSKDYAKNKAIELTRAHIIEHPTSRDIKVEVGNWNVDIATRCIECCFIQVSYGDYILYLSECEIHQ